MKNRTLSNHPALQQFQKHELKEWTHSLSLRWLHLTLGYQEQRSNLLWLRLASPWYLQTVVRTGAAYFCLCAFFKTAPLFPSFECILSAFALDLAATTSSFSRSSISIFSNWQPVVLLFAILFRHPGPPPLVSRQAHLKRRLAVFITTTWVSALAIAVSACRESP